jgi:hypothetical protein
MQAAGSRGNRLLGTYSGLPAYVRTLADWRRHLRTAHFRVIPYEGGWGAEADGSAAGPYMSKEAALEALLGPVMNEIKRGAAIDLRVPGSAEGDSALGTRT